MCESKIYLREGNELKLIAEEITTLIPKEDGYVFIDISGKRYEVDSVDIEYIDFVGHKVILRKK